MAGVGESWPCKLEEVLFREAEQSIFTPKMRSGNLQDTTGEK